MVKQVDYTGAAAIVKKLDHIRTSTLVDHVGWDLWRAAEAWKARFAAAMAARGHPWFGEARAQVFGRIDRAGTRQAELVGRLRTTKQAVQQLVDELVDQGLVMREPDPADGRARIVRFTAAGLRVLEVAAQVKREIEATYAADLGDRGLAELKRGLRRLSE